MTKQVAELDDGTLFIHTYDLNHVHKVIHQVCEGGKDTGILDYVETCEIAFKNNDGVWTPYGTRAPERCNPYAPVHVVAIDYTPHPFSGD